MTQDTKNILSQIDYAGIVYRKDSDAINRINEEDEGDYYRVKDFITAYDLMNVNITIVEIKADSYNTYSENDTVYYFIDAEQCDLMPASVHKGAQPKVLSVEAGSVLFIPKKSDYTFIVWKMKAVVITLQN